MKLAIVGGRDFGDIRLMDKMLALFIFEDIEKVISGGAKGADSLGEIWANHFEIPIRRFLPEWDKYGKVAGFRRNQLIVDACDIVVAFWDGESRGTADTIEKAKKAKKPTFIIYY